MSGEPVPDLTDRDVELLEEVSAGYRRLREEVGKVIIGQDEVVRALLAAIFSEGHALLVGVPGLAKTLLVKTLSDILGWNFNRIQFTPDLMPADIIGMELLQDTDDGHRRMKFVPGPVFANIILADEINRTPPKTQSALLEAMQEYHVTSMGHSHPIEKPFVVVATQNPIEQEGTYPLPEAQLDRFMFSLWVDYPSAAEEREIVMSTTAPHEVHLEPVYAKERFVAFQELVRRMPMTPHVVDYAVSIARATRPGQVDANPVATQYVEWGAGPRAAQYMILGAKAMAALDGMPAVSCGHVLEVAPYVLRHRVLPNYRAAGENLQVTDLMKRILDEVPVPTYAT